MAFAEFLTKVEGMAMLVGVLFLFFLFVVTIIWIRR